MKIGVFGGSFNPPHMGHLNAAQTVLKLAGLDQIIIVPTSQNPLKVQVEGPTAGQRYEMAKLVFENWGSQYLVDDFEITKGGKSYSIDTIKHLKQKYKNDDLYFIIGSDNFHEMEQWKQPDQLISEVNWIVTSRPGFDFPDSEEELPEFIKKQVADFDFNFIELKTEKSIQFIKLKDIPISASELRKWLRVSKNVEKYIPLSVESYIKANKLYQPVSERIGDFEKFTLSCARVLFAKKGINVRAFDLRKMSASSEFTLVASGTSTKHASSLAENLVRAVKEEYNVLPQGIEGVDEGRWVVVDYGSLMVHVFYDFVRQEYSIENLWKDAVDMNVKDTEANS